jgi:uncharacterized SAM-binding protein YcdF (DUF218 family)
MRRARSTGLFGRALQVVGALALLGGAGVLALFLVGGHWLSRADVLEPADGIVVLGGDFSRALHAADLYAQGLAPVVWVSVTAPHPAAARLAELGIRLPEQADVYVAALRAKGVDAAAIRRFGAASVSTVEEAEELDAALAARGTTPVRLILVTTAYHAARARMIFRDHFPHTRVLVAPTPDDAPPGRWWTRRDSAANVLMETVKTLFYLGGGGFRSGQGLRPGQDARSNGSRPAAPPAVNPA